MAFEKCSKCGGLHWSTDACKVSPSAASLSGLPLAEQLSGATKPDTSGLISATTGTKGVTPNPAQAANPLERIISKANGPDDTQEPVRSNTPKPVNRNEYHKLNMRKWRAAKKALTSQAVNNG